MDAATPRTALRVLVVSTNPALLASLADILSDPRLEPRLEPEAVRAELAVMPVDGLIVDGAMPRFLATTLAEDFLRHHAYGRVAILAKTDDATTLVGLAMRDPRCDLFFPPYDRHALLNFLRMTAEDSVRPEPVGAR